MKKGFTLLELIIVIIIIGILMGIALPKFMNVVEKARTAEGRSILGAIRSAQMRFYFIQAAEHPENIPVYCCAGFACNGLDISFTARTNFNPPYCYPAALSALASIQRSPDNYGFVIYENGDILCFEGTGQIKCSNVGCPVGGGFCP